MYKDPIVEEVRRARYELFEEAGGTLETFCQMLRERHGDGTERKQEHPKQERQVGHAA